MSTTFFNSFPRAASAEVSASQTMIANILVPDSQYSYGIIYLILYIYMCVYVCIHV